MRSRFLPLPEAADMVPCHLSTLHWHRHYGSLVVVRFEDGSLAVREAELHRWKAERAAHHAEKLRQAEQRRQERAERKARWLSRIAAENGLVRAA